MLTFRSRGFDAQVNGAMIAVPAFRRDFGYIFEGEPVLPASWQTAFNIVSAVGQFFGGFLCSQVADKIGRKKSIAVGILVCTGGIIGQMVTTSKGGFLAAKLVLGLGLGFYLTLGPLCCSEVKSALHKHESPNVNTIYRSLQSSCAASRQQVSTWA
jgi:MFS family permease